MTCLFPCASLLAKDYNQAHLSSHMADPIFFFKIPANAEFTTSLHYIQRCKFNVRRDNADDVYNY